MSELKNQIIADMKAAMKGGDKPRLGVIRLIQAAIKQQEVDNRIELDDAQILAVLDKMLKQRKDSLQQYQSAGRQDLADQESFEIEVITAYLPAQLSEAEINSAIESAISESGAASMRDMGKVMGILKPKLQGRADMGQVSGLIKQRLNT
jgi:uncharacterized protein YqeY